MSLNRITKLFLTCGLLCCFVGFSGIEANAKREERRTSDRKRCHDYDRNASADEERSSGDCSGTVPTPEPVSIILFTAGLAGVGFAARRRLRRSE